MPENFFIEISEDEKLLVEHEELLSRFRTGGEKLSDKDRKRLAELGYLYLKKDNTYQANRSFEALCDFEGLRNVADYLLKEFPDSADLSNALIYLEDHEGIRNLLNSDIKLTKLTQFSINKLFYPLTRLLMEYVNRFLSENGTLKATGSINAGVDLIAIKNLASKYDIAIPIARGGLNQGALASLWGMPTRILDISAHDRKVPKGKWANPIMPEDFAGKRVLLFDKDAVSGATVKKAKSMLDRFRPASIGIYFTHNVADPIGIGTHLEGLPKGLDIFYPKNAPLEKAGDIYMEAHEKLGTLYGRRRQIEHIYSEKAQMLQEQYPDLSESLKKNVLKNLSVFDSLNPYLPGVTEVRESILKKLKNRYDELEDYLRTNSLDNQDILRGFIILLDKLQPLAPDFGNEFIKARYEERAVAAAKKKNVENIHLPSNQLAAFQAAQKAVKHGYDIALIVGPEGFAYEPYFEDLGLATIAVNIPESGEDELRTIKIFDDLSKLNGKKVLVVEDDVRTGATLLKLLENLKEHPPANLGLYLGQTKEFQEINNIPPNFSDTFIASDDTESAAVGFLKFLESKGFRIFKNTGTDK